MSMNAAELQSKFADRGITRGCVLILPPVVAIDYIKAARGIGLKILGIDAFELTEVRTQPILEHSADFSTDVETRDTWSVAEGFIRDRATLGLYFEVVI
jgi:hypothetical protein